MRPKATPKRLVAKGVSRAPGATVARNMRTAFTTTPTPKGVTQLNRIPPIRTRGILRGS
jgi:hypothetical protein